MKRPPMRPTDQILPRSRPEPYRNHPNATKNAPNPPHPPPQLEPKPAAPDACKGPESRGNATKRHRYDKRYPKPQTLALVSDHALRRPGRNAVETNERDAALSVSDVIAVILFMTRQCQRTYWSRWHCLCLLLCWLRLRGRDVHDSFGCYLVGQLQGCGQCARALVSAVDTVRGGRETVDPHHVIDDRGLANLNHVGRDLVRQGTACDRTTMVTLRVRLT
jgi:hypothetical protein